LVKFKVVWVAPLRVGVPGVFAEVYVDEILEAVPVLGVGVTESLAVTV
jgi:hypothetical protein